MSATQGDNSRWVRRTVSALGGIPSLYRARNLLACALWVAALLIGCSSSRQVVGDKRQSLFVEVTDRSGNLAPGVSVSLDPTGETCETDEFGSVLFAGLEVGSYRVLAQHPELGRASTAAQVTQGETTSMQLTLEGQPWSPGDDSDDLGGDDIGGDDVYGDGFGGDDVYGDEPGDENELTDPYIDVGTQVERMLADPGRPYLYALDKVNNSLLFIHAGDREVEKTVFVGSSPVDMDISLDGKELFIANFGSTEITIVDLDEQEVGRSVFVDTQNGTWNGNPYRIEALGFDLLAFTSEDQWNDIKVVNASNGTPVQTEGSLYSPDLEASPDAMSLYIGESGSGLHRYSVADTGITLVDSSASGGGYPVKVIVTQDGEHVFYGGQKFLAANLKSVLGEFGEIILAANADGTIAVGESRIYDGNMFSILRPLPFTTQVSAMAADGKVLYLYDIERSRIYIHDISDLAP